MGTSGIATVYKYDLQNRISGVAEYYLNSKEYRLASFVSYNDKNLVDVVRYRLEHTYSNERYTHEHSYRYEYDDNDRLTSSVVDTQGYKASSTYSYDSLNKLSKIQTSYFSDSSLSQKFNSITRYEYTDNYYYVSRYISTVDYRTKYYSYYYDDCGNILIIDYEDETETRYVYDDLGQLIREDNALLDKTYTYEYDNAGNITAVNEYEYTNEGVTPTSSNDNDEKSYHYSTDGWGDRLVSFNGNPITYDNIGNPITYFNDKAYTFTWEATKLVGATFDSNTYTFTYNDEGIRTSKKKNNVVTTYYLDGGRIIGEETSGNVTLYLYDANGSPIGMQYREASYADDTWDIFWYEKNLQGDIVAVYDEEGTKLVSYAYDAWGNHTSTYYNNGDETPVVNNPFRYRGYYYDINLELYCLGTRYYDSYIGRFISPDNVSYLGANGDLNSYNLYAYCSNNPVNKYDPTGHSAIGIIIGVILAVAAIAATVNDIYQIQNLEVTTNGEESVAIENSYKLVTPWVRYGYCFYLNHFNSNTKDIIQGTTAGLQYEWELHNYAAWLGFGASAQTLNAGGTIFADGKSHPLRDGNGKITPEGAMSIGMRATYIMFGNPICWIYDLIENGGF